MEFTPRVLTSSVHNSKLCDYLFYFTGQRDSKSSKTAVTSKLATLGIKSSKQWRIL